MFLRKRFRKRQINTRSLRVHATIVPLNITNSAENRESFKKMCIRLKYSVYTVPIYAAPLQRRRARVGVGGFSQRARCNQAWNY